MTLFCLQYLFMYILHLGDNMNKMEYKKYVDKQKKKMNKTKDLLIAFLFGGCIGAFGQLILEGYMYFFNLTFKEASTPMTITMIFIASLLTALGLFDKVAGHAGAGTFIPITGFANSMTSSAMEAKAEGLVAGIGSNMFRLAGTVITYGVVSAYIIGVIRYVINFIFF